MKKIKLKMISLPIAMGILAAYYFFNASENIDSSEIFLNILALAVVIMSTFPNIKQHIYSDKLNFSVMGLGVVINLLIATGLYSDNGDPYIFLQKLGFSIGGILLGGGSFYVMGLLGDFLFKKESVGGGDVKLVASIGSLIGPSAAWLAPLWIPSAILFFVIYRAGSKLLKKYADTAVPSAPIHFTSLASFVFIQLELINPLIVTLVLLINIYAAYVIAKPSSEPEHKDDNDEDIIDVTAITENLCPKCNKTNDTKARFCGFCGKKFIATIDNSNETDLKANKINISQVRPWVRFFARMIDGTIFVFIVVIVLIFTAPSITSSLGLNDYVFGFICCFLWIFVESFFLSQWGTTPGKWIYATSVKKRNGNNLRYSDALKRSFGVWIKGIGLGIPIVAFFTQINAYNTLERESVTSWDKEGDSVVFHSRIGWWRIILIIFCFLFLATLHVYSIQ